MLFSFAQMRRSDRLTISKRRPVQHGSDSVRKSMPAAVSHELTPLLARFFFPYAIFEVPSNIVLKLMRPSIWISILMVLWGIVSRAE